MPTSQPPDDSRAGRRPGDLVTLSELGTILRRQAPAMILVSALILAAALVYLSLAQPLYRTAATLLLDPRGGTSLSADAGQRPSMDTSVLESQAKLIASPAVLGRVVDAEQLVKNPEFGSGRPGLLQRAKEALGLRPAPAPPVLGDPKQAATAALAERLVVRRSERTLILEVEAWSVDPKTAARLANGVAKAFIDDQIDTKSKASNAESVWIDRRLAELGDKIHDAEARVETFKTQARIVSANGRLVSEQKLETATAELAKAQLKTFDARTRLAETERALKTGDPGATGDAAKSGVIQQLRLQYAEIRRQQDTLGTTLGARHPALQEVGQQLAGIRSLLAAELRRIAETQRGEVAIAVANEALLKRQVDDQNRDAVQTNQSIVRLRELEREVEAARAIYLRFLKANGNLAQDSVDTPVARIIAPAIAPDRPSSPNTRAVLLIALACAVAASLVVAILRHRQPMAVWRPAAGRGLSFSGSAEAGPALQRVGAAAPRPSRSPVTS
ncbi:GumC family protein [Methylobacterium sp. J-090]|uniref:GumC family protein n=1 Tax=Methylobacterium sp. J-090 TaxID=2836666 RepID=UPI001FBA2757|nr:GumC family protein [Methylobacterium sp. J-090]MCJ2083859.1 GumC family protein [Methylobacterium sp. J-090]